MPAQSREFLFSVVVPTYNVEPWIDTFFMSLVKQTSGLGDLIQVIVVDDGSTDRSTEIAKKWAAQYPENIIYVRKENGGLSSARNHGLQFVKGKWVTFSDPDDFFHEDYFAVVKNFLEQNNFNGLCISCNPIIYDEATKRFVNSHPLNFRYAEDLKIINLMNNPEYIQLQVCSSFINCDKLKSSKRVFDSRVKPSFEDAHLLNNLIIQTENYEIAFLKKSIYYCRKKQSGINLADVEWRCKEKYKEQIMFGYLDLLRSAQHKYGVVPEFIQNIIICETQAYMNRMLDNSLTSIFPKEGLDIFIDLMRMLYAYINAKNVLFSKLPMISWQTRIALLSTFKELNLPESPILIHEIAPDKRSMLLIRYGKEKGDCSVYLGSKESKPLWEKVVHRDFYGIPLCVEQYLWVPIDSETPVSIKVDGQPVAMIAGENLLLEATMSDVVASMYYPETALPERTQSIRKSAQDPEIVEKFGKCWLFMDRQDKADDNAEHLYRWMMHNAESGQKIYYALDRKSPDWDRLAREGFNLIPHRSRQFYLALFNAEWVLSSHYQHHVFDPMYIRDIFGIPDYKFAFLQHGIMTHDMSKWVLPKKIDLFVTSTCKEYESIVCGNYKSTEREVVLTGLPRHDELLKKRAKAKKEKIIMVCPTWREHLCKPHIHDLPEASESLEFAKSDYYQSWNAVTSSSELSSIAQEYGYKFIFLPHPYTSRLTSLFEYSDSFTCVRYSDIETIQDLLAKSAMLITDYSSVGMEAAFAGLPLIYYQFKETPAFFSSHTVVNGYFSYEKNGFGPVVTYLSELISCLSHDMAIGCKRQDPYESRADEFFTLRDGCNCKRVYEKLMLRSTVEYPLVVENHNKCANFV